MRSTFFRLRSRVDASTRPEQACSRSGHGGATNRWLALEKIHCNFHRCAVVVARGRGRVLILSTPLCSAPPLTPDVRLRHIAPFPLSTLNPQTGKFIHRLFESRTADCRLTIMAADCTQAGRRGWPTERARTAAAACRRKSDGRGR